MIFRRSFTSALLIGAVFVLLPASPAYGDLIVNGTSVEDDNGLAGIQRATTIQVSWNPNQFVSYPDDTCLNTKRFANLQSALYAINQGLVDRPSHFASRQHHSRDRSRASPRCAEKHRNSKVRCRNYGCSGIQSDRRAVANIS